MGSSARRAEAGFLGAQPEFMIVIAALTICAAIAAPNAKRAQIADERRICAGRIMALAARSGAGASMDRLVGEEDRCPRSGAPYRVLAAEGAPARLTGILCPEPSRHALPSDEGPVGLAWAPGDPDLAARHPGATTAMWASVYVPAAVAALIVLFVLHALFGERVLDLVRGRRRGAAGDGG